VSAPEYVILNATGIDKDATKIRWKEVTDAASYNIYRSITRWGFDFSSPIYSGMGIGVGGGEREWLDTTTEWGTGAYKSNTYYYIIRAVDSTGKEEKNYNTKGIHRMKFIAGWNFISWDVYKSVDIVTEGLGYSPTVGLYPYAYNPPSDAPPGADDYKGHTTDAHYDKIQRWNPQTQEMESFTTNAFVPDLMNDFDDFEPGYGYAIHCTTSCVWVYVET
jgi:hypothetical protein